MGALQLVRHQTVPPDQLRVLFFFLKRHQADLEWGGFKLCLKTEDRNQVVAPLINQHVKSPDQLELQDMPINKYVRNPLPMSDFLSCC
jgi:hypothetical protein